ncbi:hypothetical protein GCM10010347_19870 [Streptomyces cirratus]|uniref:Uncharacterized protein n=1 Tax=Streptomyces cirratus TaxID=68187 RepID=A0ABQ3EPR3_9ACTN|nr:hypothetical protein GCM10010347_19870 [Streptomyces cirratus]
MPGRPDYKHYARVIRVWRASPRLSCVRGGRLARLLPASVAFERVYLIFEQAKIYVRAGRWCEQFLLGPGAAMAPGPLQCVTSASPHLARLRRAVRRSIAVALRYGPGRFGGPGSREPFRRWRGPRLQRWTAERPWNGQGS